MNMKWTGIVLILSLVGLLTIYYGISGNRGNSVEAEIEASDVNTVEPEAVSIKDSDLETHDSSFPLERSPDVPELPFDDNPDPTLCGIPVMWGDVNNIAYLTGIYEGELIQPIVFLYDSHARMEIVAEAAHGTQVEIIMFQQNPTLNYYFVRIPDAPVGEREGWIPAPFLSFDAPI